MKNKNTFVSAVLACVCTVLLIYVNTAGRTSPAVSTGTKEAVDTPAMAKIEYKKLPSAEEAEKLCKFLKENNIKAQITVIDGVTSEDIKAVGIFTSNGHKIITSIKE